MADLTYDIVRQLLKYEPETGKLFWLERGREFFATHRGWRIWNAQNAGREALTAICRGYRVGDVLGRKHNAHRICWLLACQTWPLGQIDHIDGNGLNNALSNLRDVTHQENGQNQRKPKNNTSGVTGVCWVRRDQKWQATIMVDGRNKSLGCYDNIDDAARARRAAEASYGFHPNHGA